MSGVENYLRQKAAEARRDNPNLSSMDEIRARAAEQAAARQAAEQAEQTVELKRIRRLLEERRSQ